MKAFTEFSKRYQDDLKKYFKRYSWSILTLF
jgi:hypothetical protein